MHAQHVTGQANCTRLVLFGEGRIDLAARLHQENAENPTRRLGLGA
jgi:hypothetical protein